MHLNRLPVHKLSKDIGRSIRAVKVVQVKLGLVLGIKARPFIKIEKKVLLLSTNSKLLCFL